MNETTWKNVESKHATLVGEYVDLSEDARALLTDEATSEDYYSLLRKSKLWLDAIRFLAAALSARGTVFWAAKSVREHLGDDATEDDLEALRLTEQWLGDPAEEIRYAAFAFAQKMGFKAPTSWVATSAFWSGPSMAPPEAPAIPPGPGLAGKAAGGALLLTAAAEPKTMEKSYLVFLDLGERIACGEQELPEITTPPPAPADEDGAIDKEKG
jgi:hypothetical protein